MQVFLKLALANIRDKSSAQILSLGSREHKQTTIRAQQMHCFVQFS